MLRWRVKEPTYRRTILRLCAVVLLFGAGTSPLNAQSAQRFNDVVAKVLKCITPAPLPKDDMFIELGLIIFANQPDYSISMKGKKDRWLDVIQEPGHEELEVFLTCIDGESGFVYVSTIQGKFLRSAYVRKGSSRNAYALDADENGAFEAEKKFWQAKEESIGKSCSRSRKGGR
jgi:hypothetical protein